MICNQMRPTYFGLRYLHHQCPLEIRGTCQVWGGAGIELP